MKMDRKKPTESAMMDVIKKNRGFGVLDYKTVTIKGERYSMKAVKEVLESLRKKKKLKKTGKTGREKGEKYAVTYYPFSMKKEDVHRYWA